jgi:hypothetical protein
VEVARGNVQVSSKASDPKAYGDHRDNQDEHLDPNTQVAICRL